MFILLMVILLLTIRAYFINDYLWLFVHILLMTIRDYSCIFY
jgi:hypothetical protein